MFTEGKEFNKQVTKKHRSLMSLTVSGETY